MYYQTFYEVLDFCSYGKLIKIFYRPKITFLCLKRGKNVDKYRRTLKVWQKFDSSEFPKPKWTLLIWKREKLSPFFKLRRKTKKVYHTTSQRYVRRLLRLYKRQNIFCKFFLHFLLPFFSTLNNNEEWKIANTRKTFIKSSTLKVVKIPIGNQLKKLKLLKLLK